MEEMDFDVKKPLVGFVVVIIILFFLSMQLQGLGLEEGVSTGYTDFYGNYAVIALTMAVVTGFLFYIVRIRWGHIITSKWLTLMIIAGFAFYIVVLTTGAGQIMPVPRASMHEFQLNPGTELYTSSVIPAILEDWIILYCLPFMLFIAIGMIIEIPFDYELGRWSVIGLALICCFIASVGYNVWVIPGFVSQHVPAYGGQTEAYVGAWLFAFPQSVIYFFTGVFFPVAHFLHNFIITYGSLYQIVGGPFMIGGI